jgi:hypothetical protein
MYELYISAFHLSVEHFQRYVTINKFETLFVTLYSVAHLVLKHGSCLCDTEIFNHSIHITEAYDTTFIMIIWCDVLKVNPHHHTIVML